LLVLLGAAGCVDRDRAPEGTPPPAPAEGISFGLSQSDLDGNTISQMNLSRTRDLWVRVRVAGMARVAQVKLEFVKPTGDVFYEELTPYSPDPTMNTMPMPGIDHPVQVFGAKQFPGGYALDRAIPIGGTVFERYPTPGTWTVRATIEGQAKPFSAPLDVIVQR
jgi:hypothetical protein